MGSSVATFRAAAAAAAAGVFLSLTIVAAAEPAIREVRIGMIARKPPPPPPAFRFDAVPEDEGFAGARVAIKENNTTGAFTGRRYVLDEAPLKEGEPSAETARKLIEGGAGFLLVNLPADDLIGVADAVRGRDAIVFNVGAPDDRLRGADCRANVFHIVPSRAMLTDALAQFLAFKRWRKLFLIVGPKAGDKLYAEAMKRSARKFGLVVSAEKTWEFGPLVQTKGDSPAQADALVFTRGADYDMAVVAGGDRGFWGYLPPPAVGPPPGGGTPRLRPASLPAP